MTYGLQKYYSRFTKNYEGGKRKAPDCYQPEACLYGADGEIRTLEELMTLTRFPIVRARPTTRHLHTAQEIELY